MTNEQIILTAKAKLVADGKIKPEEELHTYKHWKKLGYQVFRGEKSVACLNIWQFFQKTEEQDDEEEQKKDPEGKMRMKKTHFFSTSQAFAIEG